MAYELIAENIYRIPVSLGNTPLKELNAYLIKGDGHNLLIDTGYRRADCREALETGLRELEVDMRETDIFLTHLHSDHSGNAPDIVAENRRIYISDIDLAFIRNGEAARHLESYHYKKSLVGGMPEKELNDFFAFDARGDISPHPGSAHFEGLKDGAVFRVGGYTLHCLLTPGHTPGHMCLWEPERGIMFTGDHILFDISPNIVCWEGFEDPLGQYIESLKKTDGYDVRLALPGHRKPGDFHARIGQLIRHHWRRLRETMDIVAADPGLTAYQAASRMSWNIHSKRGSDWEGFPLPQKYFALGECQSHLAYLRNRGAIARELAGGVYHYTVAGSWEAPADGESGDL